MLPGVGAMAMRRYSAFSQSSSITGSLPSDCLVSYPRHSLGSLTPLQRCVSEFYSSSPLGLRSSDLLNYPFDATMHIHFCTYIHQTQPWRYVYITYIYAISAYLWRCPWCSRYRRRKWTRRHEFKSWTRLIAFHIALIPLGKVWIQLFSLQLWVNSRTD